MVKGAAYSGAVDPTPTQASPHRDYYQGSVVMRRSRVPGSTTDQRLLDSRGSADWVHTDPWRVMRTAYLTQSHAGRLVAMDWPRPGLRLNG